MAYDFSRKSSPRLVLSKHPNPPKSYKIGENGIVGAQAAGLHCSQPLQASGLRSQIIRPTIQKTPGSGRSRTGIPGAQCRRTHLLMISRRTYALISAVALFAQVLFPCTFALSNDELTALSLTEAAAKIRSGAVTSTQLTEACLARIAIYDPKLDAFITVMKEQALAEAKQLDAEQKAGKLRGPLHGVPIALKDNIDAIGARTTAASGVFEDRVAPEDAPVVERLKAAGAVIIGKTNLQEFAMGIGESSYFGPARNPWNLANNTGGSSSRSGAAGPADLFYGALGTDTAGSVRIPASFCSLVGLKATYGLVPIRGIAPLTVSLDHCGPLTRTVEDTALMLNVMAGYDKFDITSVEHPKKGYLTPLSQPVSVFRSGRSPYFF